MSHKTNKWWILTGVCLFTVMLNIDVTAINIAIPIMAHDFRAKLSGMQWVINSYVLVSSMLAVLGGRLGDIYGHRKLFLYAVICFIVSSCGAGLSVNEFWLIFFRALQGIGLGIAYPLTIALTFETFSKEKQAFALSFIVAAMGVSLAVGPLVGGVFVNYFSWRWIFFINIPIGIIIYTLIKLFCEDKKSEETKYIDYKGSFFLVLGLFGITFALNQLQNFGLKSPIFLSILIVGFVFLLILYFITKKQSFPIIDFKLFKNRNFTLNNIIRLIVQIVFVSVLFFMPLYLQNIAGYSPLRSGFLMLYLTLVIGLVSLFAGKWVDKIGDKLPNIIAMVLFALSCALFYFLQVFPQMFLLASALFCIGFATSIGFVSTTIGSVAMLDYKDHGVGTGILLTIGWFGCALGIALMGSFLTKYSQNYLLDTLSFLKIQLSGDQLSELERAAQGILSSDALEPYGLSDFSDIAKLSFMHGFKISMMVWGGLSFIGFVLSLFLKKHEPVEPESTAFSRSV